MARRRFKSMSEVTAQINRIQQMGGAGTGVSYRRFAKAAGRVSSLVRAGERLNPFASRHQTNAYLLKGKGLSVG